MIAAVVARGADDDAEPLTDFHNTLLDHLTARGIYAISNSHDGTECERSVQRNLETPLPRHIVKVPSGNGFSPVTISVPLRNGHPFNQTQDSKHSRKTARNQVLSGARILAAGNHIIHYAQLKRIAEHPSGPLFLRDVVGLDRQDDRAAERFTSSSTLKHIVDHAPDDLGLAIYAFITGEMVDAWQNRTLSYIQRARMVFRARFFFTTWAAHIDAHPNYSQHTQFISRESFDIFVHGICDSLLSLIVSYRDFYPSYPLLPWLHSTECCEHIFGIARYIKEDFSIGDFMQILPKLVCLIQGDFGNLSPQEQANKTAAGYHHTYFKSDDVDLNDMHHWPSDEDLQLAASAATNDVIDLMALLGIDARSLQPKSSSPDASPSPQATPPDVQVQHAAEISTTSAPSDPVLAEEPQPPSFRELLQLRDVLPLKQKDEDDKRDALVAAIISAEAHIQGEMYVAFTFASCTPNTNPN